MELNIEKCITWPPEGVYDLNLPPQTIGVLQQVRTKMTREGLDNLMASIKAIGQKTPGVVVGFTEQEGREYLRQINDLWGTDYRLEDFEPVYFDDLDGNVYYLFLVTGHRRLVVVKNLEIGFYFCQLHLRVKFLDAFILQFHENIHEEVARDDEARFLTVMWRKQKSEDEALSLAEFARRYGKRPDVVRHAIRFTSLPISVQKLMLPSEEFKKGVAYGILCEMAHLQEERQAKGKPYGEQELLNLAYVLVAKLKTVKAVAAWVREQIKELNGQDSMFELSIEDAVDDARRSVVSGLEDAVRTGGEHLRAIARMHSAGGIRKVPSGSAVNTVTRTIDLVTTLAPEIVEGIRGARHAPKAREALKSVEG